MKRMAWLLLLGIVGCNGREEGPRSTFTPDQAAQMRQACAFSAGATAGLTQAKDAKIGGEIPLDTIIVLMMENRSFDHLFSGLPAFGQTDVDVADPDVTNPDDSGAPIKRFHNPSYCFDDTNHEWDGSHVEWDNGMNDGFVKANAHPNAVPPLPGDRAMGYYDQSDLPFLYAAANTFAISDRHFGGVLGPTFPNREYLYAATSYGRTTNDIFLSGNPQNILTVMEDHNALGKDPISYHIYYEGVPGFGVFIEALTKELDNVSLISTFFDDAAAGTLANVVFLDANLRDEWGGNDDFHPPADPQVGDALLAKIIQAVTTSPQWKRTALIITFDENGGLYDHVPPQPACAPDDLAPIVPAGATAYDFKSTGFRVPLLVISPYAKPHYVSHHVTDHSAITRFIEARYRLGAMTARDANAEPLSDLFDFDKAAFATPPSTLPTPAPDAQRLADCAAKYPLKMLNFLPDMSPVDAGTTD